jgi:hypothetical protein
MMVDDGSLVGGGYQTPSEKDESLQLKLGWMEIPN